MLLLPSEMDIELMEMPQKGTEGGAFSHFGKGVDILRKALATIPKLPIGPGNVRVGVIDVTR